MRKKSHPIVLVTRDEYLAREREATGRIRHEYVAGHVFAMSPENRRHSTISLNLARALLEPSRRKSCLLFQNVMVKVADDRYYYPDFVITCDPADRDVDDIVRAPCFVVEVTSPSTRSTDLREKTPAYETNQAIRGILIVEQKRRRVLSYRRTAPGQWEGIALVGSGTVDVPCIDATISLEEIYEGLDLPRMVVREEGGEDEFTMEDYEREWARIDALKHALKL